MQGGENFSNFSKFSQKFMEMFDKDRKTQDSEEFLARIKSVNSHDARIKAYIKNVKDFIESNTVILQQNIIFSNAMYELY